MQRIAELQNQGQECEKLEEVVSTTIKASSYQGIDASLIIFCPHYLAPLSV